MKAMLLVPYSLLLEGIGIVMSSLLPQKQKTAHFFASEARHARTAFLESGFRTHRDLSPIRSFIRQIRGVLMMCSITESR